jgi:hypothetical protein
MHHSSMRQRALFNITDQYTLVDIPISSPTKLLYMSLFVVYDASTLHLVCRILIPNPSPDSPLVSRLCT